MAYNVTTNTKTSHQKDVELWLPSGIGDYVEGVFEGCGYEFLPSYLIDERSVKVMLSKKDEKKKMVPMYVRMYCLYLYRKDEKTDYIIPDRQATFSASQVVTNGELCRIQLAEVKDNNQYIYRIFKKEEDMGALTEKILPDFSGGSSFSGSGELWWLKINGKTGECRQRTKDLEEVVTGGWVFYPEAITYDYTETFKGSDEYAHHLSFRFREDIGDKESTLFILPKRVDQNLTIRILRLLANADLTKELYLDARMNGQFVEPLMAQRDENGQWKPITMAYNHNEVPKAQEVMFLGKKTRDTRELTAWGVNLASELSKKLGGTGFDLIDPETRDLQ